MDDVRNKDSSNIILPPKVFRQKMHKQGLKKDESLLGHYTM
jgi:hypothetical protein